ncbi:hypothetical protein [Microbacterium sp. SLBN-146]|uniref:hypothetical protein n=1 Tax=Microbacterium sp. SLBN-146 TaxID=2768457 RepID=UPI001152B8B8|nr:hypothetical protein [Microbacterium sp. SLBN-146]TQJ31393.1 hypothetical protein FBY39_1862 [Microbacterium sp. SLBN-146]
MAHRFKSAALVTAVSVLVLSGCAGVDRSAAGARESEDAPSPTATEEALPTVSLETTCGLLFGSNVDGPVTEAADIITRFVEAPDLSTVTEDELDTTVGSLDGASRNADPTIVPYIEAQSDVLNQLLNALRTGENSNLDLVDFKAASLELLNRCDPYL